MFDRLRVARYQNQTRGCAAPHLGSGLNDPEHAVTAEFLSALQRGKSFMPAVQTPEMNHAAPFHVRHGTQFPEQAHILCPTVAAVYDRRLHHDASVSPIPKPRRQFLAIAFRVRKDYPTSR